MANFDPAPHAWQVNIEAMKTLPLVVSTPGGGGPVVLLPSPGANRRIVLYGGWITGESDSPPSDYYLYFYQDPLPVEFARMRPSLVATLWQFPFALKVDTGLTVRGPEPTSGHFEGTLWYTEQAFSS